MKKWFENTSYKIQQWMQGRYGMDELSNALSIVSLAFLIFSLFPSMRLLYLPAILLMLCSCIRCYSKNLAKRQAERAAFLRVTGRIKNWFTLQRNKWRDRKTYRYFRCKDCKATLRVPKGKGKILIHCPKCHSELEAKT